MTTATISPPITGAPYHKGDPVTVEYQGSWCEATVTKVERIHGPGRFGLVWSLNVTVAVKSGWLYTKVRVDDNGRNHTYRSQVCPSFNVRSDLAL